MKPPDYRARRQWQLDTRARGEVPECGREACHEPADPAWVGSGTGVELLYCAGCARLINRYTPGTCRPEHAEVAMFVPPIDLQRIEHDTAGHAAGYVISIDHGGATDTGAVTTYRDGAIVDVTSWRPRPVDTIAATSNVPVGPKFNRAQRRARGDYHRADATVRRIR